MVVHPQLGHDCYKMVILQTDRSYVLLVPEDRHFVLPEVEIPTFERVALHLTPAVRHKWGQEIVCLFSFPNEVAQESPHAASYYVAEVLERRDPAGASQWVSVESLCPESFAYAGDHQALCCSLARCRREETSPKRGPFEK